MIKTHTFRHLDLFSGIGGFALAASWVWGEQHEIHSFVEIEPFAQKVLKKHWPTAPIHGDIKTYEHDGKRIDLISGGFPCQPYSVAGKQRGAKDDRALWPEMLRVIQETKPRWIVGENVAGFINMGLDDCFSDLENAGYEATALVIPACAVGAPHRRDRCWIVANRDHGFCELANKKIQTGWDAFDLGGKTVAHTNGQRSQRLGHSRESSRESSREYQRCQPIGRGYQENVAHTNKIRRGRVQQQPGILQKEDKASSDAAGCLGPSRGENGIWSTWEVEPAVGRVADGIPSRVDRIKGLGNAIVPQVAASIFECIKLIDLETQMEMFG